MREPRQERSAAHLAIERYFSTFFFPAQKSYQTDASGDAGAGRRALLRPLK
jgi:hypothetical protein